MRDDVVAHPDRVGRAPDRAADQSARRGPRRQWSTVTDGRRVRETRQQRGLPQEGLADLAGVSLTTMARLERQEHASCRKWTLGRLAAALDEEPAAFIVTQ